MDTILLYSRTASRGRIAFAVATAAFFLMCHGLLGASHALGSVGLPADLPNDDVQPHQMQGHGVPASHDPGGTASHGSGWGLMYASVVAASAIGVLLLFSFVRACFILRFAATHGRGVSFHRKGLAPCRGPTLPALQVFRL